MVPRTSLAFPKKSHRKEVNLPRHSVQLAEFFWIMLGDGGINNDWQANITLNATADKRYVRFVVTLCEWLFKISSAIRHRRERNTTIISLASTSVVDFLVAQGLVRGNKVIQETSVPPWIYSKRSYRIACVRGLMDTDGCLFIQRHKTLIREYTYIGLCFTNYCPAVIQFMVDTFADFAITAHISDQGRRVYLYSEKDVLKYLRTFGTSNERISSVYKKWRGG